MRGQIATALLVAALVLLIVAAPAVAQGGWDNGEGLAGELNDKIVTAFGLGLVVFFPLVIVIGNALVNALERRKERAKAAAARRRAGW